MLVLTFIYIYGRIKSWVRYKQRQSNCIHERKDKQGKSETNRQTTERRADKTMIEDI